MHQILVPLNLLLSGHSRISDESTTSPFPELTLSESTCYLIFSNEKLQKIEKQLFMYPQAIEFIRLRGFNCRNQVLDIKQITLGKRSHIQISR
jgi:hypothetical protein